MTVFIPAVDFVVTGELDLAIMVGPADSFGPIDDFTPANSLGPVVRPFSMIHLSPVILEGAGKDLGPTVLGFTDIFVSRSLFIPSIQFGPVLLKFVLVADYVLWPFWSYCPLLCWDYGCSHDLFLDRSSGCFRDPF